MKRQTTQLLLVGAAAAAGLMMMRRHSLRDAVAARGGALRRGLALFPAAMRAVEWDYAGVLRLIAAWCERAASHHAEQQLVDGWQRTCRELRWAATLCRRIIEPPYLTTLRYDIRDGLDCTAKLSATRLRNAGITRIAQAQQDADVAALAHLLRRKMRTWWD